jgi:hypothetical protein
VTALDRYVRDQASANKIHTDDSSLELARNAVAANGDSLIHWREMGSSQRSAGQRIFACLIMQWSQLALPN